MSLNLIRGFKNLTFTKAEVLVRNATRDDDEDIPAEILAEFTDLTFSEEEEEYKKMYEMWLRRLNDYPCVNHVRKALLILEYCTYKSYMKTLASERFIEDVKQDIRHIQKLTGYRYFKNGMKEIASPIRELANIIVKKLSEEDYVYRDETKKKPKIYEKSESIFEELNEEEIENNHYNDEQGFVEFEDVGDVFQIIGRIGKNSGKLNGVYKILQENIGGRLAFYRMCEDDDPILFWFWDVHKAWMISRRSMMESQAAYACVKQDIEHPLDITANFLVFDSEDEIFKIDTNMKICIL